MHLIYLIHVFHNLSWIPEINELFHDIIIYWDAPVISPASIFWQVVQRSTDKSTIMKYRPENGSLRYLTNRGWQLYRRRRLPCSLSCSYIHSEQRDRLNKTQFWVCNSNLSFILKGLVHPKMTIRLCFTPPRGILGVYDSSWIKHGLKCLLSGLFLIHVAPLSRLRMKNK